MIFVYYVMAENVRGLYEALVLYFTETKIKRNAEVILATQHSKRCELHVVSVHTALCI